MISGPVDVWYVCRVVSLPVGFISEPAFGSSDVLEGVAIEALTSQWLLPPGYQQSNQGQICQQKQHEERPLRIRVHLRYILTEENKRVWSGLVWLR